MSVRSDSFERRPTLAQCGSPHSEPAERLSTLQLLAYSAPVCAMIFLWNPTVSILPGMYAK